MKKRILLIISVLAVILIAVFLILRIAVWQSPQPVNQTGKGNVITAQAEGQLIAVAQDADEKGDLLKAKEAYQKLIEKFPASDKISKAQETLENLNIRILFSSIMTGDSVSYTIEKGDNLIKIAKKFNTTPDLIAKVNNVKDTALRIGKKLKISKAKFSIVVDKSQNILTLKSGQDVLKTYRVSTGKNSCTPVGAFKIVTKIINPPWYPPTGGVIQAGDPKNVLGSRWLGLSKQSYGIHGTIQPESIGQSVTEGCVRMKNADVEELYCIVPAGTEVVIVD
ncbi:MAG: L,D-transpeptidase family protein [Candidatus Omnitrophota bacterium]|jgi:lipoprotein-anchoring transpeptidase ErfK/SrfK